MENLLRSSVDFEKFTWKIENFSKQNTMKLRSKAFKIRGWSWRILVHPLRKDVKHFSLFLTVADSLPPYGWSRNTFFKLALINQVDRNKSIVKVTRQRFNGGHCCWGSLFLNLSDFLDYKQGYLVRDTCIIEVHICLSDFAAAKVQDNYLSPNYLTPNLNPTNDSKLSDQASESSLDDEREIVSARTSGSSPTEGEIRSSADLTLKDLIDFESLKPEEEALVPLLEEVCIWHPSLIRSQRKSTRLFRLWAFISLGQILYFLRTKKVKDISEDDCKNLEELWKELVRSSGFDLAWLEPYVQTALGVKAYMETAQELKKQMDNVVALEIKMKKLRGELAAAEAEFEVARKGLSELRKGFQVMDTNAAIGYAMF
ncbi:hypothetical protein RIF29_20885 [Crotalaria pallida]|uniref:MATH domain-containing protein n=1 Tax=Crotalaria pallida TaxID=3830 RepID=A0AAN9I7W5_CROPI